jgi:cell division protein FtsI/penicillin-binding protein 2
VNGGTIYKSQPDTRQRSGNFRRPYLSSDELGKVMEGMKDAVNQSYGTALMLNSLPFETCGKTGSAQVESKTKTNAFFVGCGPLPLESEDYDPICVLVLVENAKEGGLNAVPVARDGLSMVL